MPLDYKILTWLQSHSIDGTHKKKHKAQQKKERKKRKIDSAQADLKDRPKMLGFYSLRAYTMSLVIPPQKLKPMW